MEIYGQPILISYAKQINQVTIKHKVKKKWFFNGLFRGIILLGVLFSVFNVLQIFIK